MTRESWLSGRIGLVGGMLSLAMWVTGCAEEPQPVETPAAETGSNESTKAGGKQEPVVNEAPAKPPVQSEPDMAANPAPRSVTPEELQSIIAQSGGKAVLVDFWATWCQPCRKQFPHTVELSKKHATDLVVLAVSMDATDEATLAEVGKFYAEHDSGNVQTLINADGGSGAAYSGFEITNGALPHYKLYGRDGKLIQAFGGDVDNPFSTEDIDKAVVAAIAKESA